jgi:CDP-glucose 4,6-dehydratase
VAEYQPLGGVELKLMAASYPRGFWSGRRVLITGHSGFKGSWLACLLHRLGVEVSGYALGPPSNPNLYDSVGVARLGISTIGDIRDQTRITAEMQAAEPEIVFHLAAQSLVGPARTDPIETLSTNVLGTAHVLEAVRATPSVKAVVAVTSDKVYENVEWAWAYREDDRLGGKEIYGASKACAEIVVQAYRNAYFSGDRDIRIATARAGNVIGGGDWAADRLVPDAMRAFSSDRPLVVRNPAAVRPWQHVLEPLAGYLRLAERLYDGGRLPPQMALNFGPHEEDAVPVATVADQLVARWGKGAVWYHDNACHPYEARLLEVDSALARSCLGWEPRWRLDKALDHTVDWYRAFYGGSDMLPVTVSQIEEYLEA